MLPLLINLHILVRLQFGRNSCGAKYVLRNSSAESIKKLLHELSSTTHLDISCCLLHFDTCSFIFMNLMKFIALCVQKIILSS